jgi:hypothetical protein
MHHFSRLIFLLAALIVTVIFSCKDDEDSAMACGCNGPVFRSIENAEASYLGDGYFIIRNELQGDSLIYGWACEQNTTLKKSPDQYTRDYIVSVNLMKACPVNDVVFPATMFATVDMVNVTAIRKK